VALERDICGFGFGDPVRLFAASAGCTIPADGTARSGTRHLHIAPTGGGAHFGIMPTGSVIGVSSVIANGAHKRVRLRCYVRFNTAPGGSGGYQRIASIGGPNGGQAVLWFNGDATDRAGVVLARRFGLSTNSLQNFGPPPSGAGGLLGGGGLVYDGIKWSTVTLTLGIWYRVILDVDFLAGPTNSTLTSSVQVTSDLAAPVLDETLTTSLVVGGTTVALGAIAFGNNGGDWHPDSNTDIDDVVYFGADGADAASTLVLPTETRILPVPITGISAAGWETGLYTDVDEIPVVVPGDAMASILGSGTTVTFTHGGSFPLQIGPVVCWKVYANIGVGSLTGSVETIIGANALAKTYALIYANNVHGLVDWTGYSQTLFDATVFGVRKQNGTQQTFLGNIFSEVLAGPWVRPLGVVMAGFPVLALCFEGFDDNGDPLEGGTLESFVGGLDIPLPTFTTAQLDVENTNPVVLDGMGRASVYIADGLSYKFILKNALGVIVRTVDHYSIPAVVPLVNPTEVPTGAFFPFAGAVAPTGYALCHGQAVSRSDWAALFAVLGTTYGVGDAATTFNLPDMRGKFPIGVAVTGTGSVRGGSGGAIDHTHTGPSHTHTVATHTHTIAHTHNVPRDGWGHIQNVPGVSGRIHTGDAAGLGEDASAIQATADQASGASSAADSGAKALTTDASGTAVTGLGNPPFLASEFIIKTGLVTGAP
jgi:microcystin-dependent protein